MRPYKLYPVVALTALLVAGCGAPKGSAPTPATSSQELSLNSAPVGSSGLAIIHEIPEFSLVGDDGKPLTKKSLLGKIWIASFIFTGCSDTCPAMVSKIQTLQHTLPESTMLVSVSVDPDKDSPEKLAEYAKFNHRKPGSWLLATGEWEDISELAMKGFYLGGGKRLLHSPRFALVDPQGRLRGYYDSREQAQMSNLVRDVSLLLQESETKKSS